MTQQQPRLDMRQESICDFLTYQNGYFIRQNNLIGLNIRENEEYVVESSEQLCLSCLTDWHHLADFSGN